jgi:hypothetical protein
MSRRWADWVGNAVEPTDAEVRGVVDGLPEGLKTAVIDATSPTDAEVAALLRRPMGAPAAGWPSWVWLAPAPALLAAAAVVAVWPSGSSGYGEVPVALDVALADAHALLGPSIDMTARGTVMVDEAGEAGTVVVLLDGGVHFEVDPHGEYRSLLVRADDVDVRVVGTVFDVTRTEDGVRVDCSRGKVSVSWPGGSTYVTGGSSWTRPSEDGSAAAIDAAGAPEGVGVGALDVPEVVSATAPSGGAARVTEALAAPDVAMVEVGQGTADDAPAAEPVGLVRAGTADDEADQLFALESRASDAAMVLEYDAFLSRHGGSAHAPGVRVKRLFALASAEPRRGVSEMRDWLDAHAEDPSAALVRFERASALHRRLGNCASALSDYRRVAERSDALGAKAAAGAGLCARSLGQDSIADRYLEQALAGGVTGSVRAEVEAALAAE